MKNQFILYGFAAFLMACGGGSEDPIPSGPDPIENTAPSTPSLVAPENNFVCLENPVNFEWGNAIDEQGDPITYELQLATDADFSQNIGNYSASNTTIEVALNMGQLYFWRVRAVDDKNLSGEYSEAFNFFTEGDATANHLPFAPGLEWPEMNSEQSDSSIELRWFAEDADEDNLIFDVYLGNDSANLNQISAEINNSNLNVDVPDPGTYYWKVVVKDGKGGTTIGQTWVFTKI